LKPEQRAVDESRLSLNSSGSALQAGVKTSNKLSG
jgi:hypothetical protein